MNVEDRMKNNIKEADKVLIGLGNELDVDFDKWNATHYPDRMQLPEWTNGYLQLLALQMGAAKQQKMAFDKIKEQIEGKDFYIVSLGMDDAVFQTFSQDEPIVTPCGGLRSLQCQQGCCKELWPVENSGFKVMEMLRKDRLTEAELMELEKDRPHCPNCGGVLAFNNLYTDHYLEEGYLTQWGEYKKWLQGTVNRSICIIELGVGMRFPSIIRFAFDKLAYYNQKSIFYRVHESLYQHTSENAQRGISVRKNALEFLLQDF